MHCHILSHYMAAYKVFGPDVSMSCEGFLATLAVKLHDHLQKAQQEILELHQAAPDLKGFVRVRER